MHTADPYTAISGFIGLPMPIERFLTNLSRSLGFSIRFYATGCGMHLQRVPYFQMFWLTSPCGEAASHGFNQFYSHWRFRLLRRCYGLAPFFKSIMAHNSIYVLLQMHHDLLTYVAARPPCS